MTNWSPGFFDELTKISVELNKGEKQRQALQFAGLGMVAAPAVAGVSNLISHGKISPWSSVQRWLPARLVGGALVGGALPAAQHLIAQSNLRKADQRVESEKELRSLGVPTPAETPDPVIGQRPPETPAPVKQASPTGADLRTPLMGNTKFPTGDSLSFAKGQLKETQNVARPKMTRPTLQAVAPQYKESTMPKVGEVMNLSEDPLIQYLKKQAAETPNPPMKPKATKGGLIEDNLEELKTRDMTPLAVSSEDVDLRDIDKTVDGQKRLDDYKTYMKRTFQNNSGTAGKYVDTEHPYKQGVVNRELSSLGVPKEALGK